MSSEGLSRQEAGLVQFGLSVSALSLSSLHPSGIRLLYHPMKPPNWMKEKRKILFFYFLENSIKSLEAKIVLTENEKQEVRAGQAGTSLLYHPMKPPNSVSV